MPFTEDDYLPSYEDLDIKDINMTSAPLRAGAHHFGKYCDVQCKEFMLCTKEEKDPRKCWREGKAVTKCGIEFFNKVRDNCADQFTQYFKCLDKADHQMSFKYCRKSQGAFDQCIWDNMGQERPEAGYFSRVRIHHTDRLKPTHEIDLPKMDEVYAPIDPSRETPPSMKHRERII